MRVNAGGVVDKTVMPMEAHDVSEQVKAPCRSPPHRILSLCKAGARDVLEVLYPHRIRKNHIFVVKPKPG